MKLREQLKIVLLLLWPPVKYPLTSNFETGVAFLLPDQSFRYWATSSKVSQLILAVSRYFVIFGDASDLKRISVFSHSSVMCITSMVRLPEKYEAVLGPIYDNKLIL